MKSHMNNAVIRSAGIAAIAVLMATMFAAGIAVAGETLYNGIVLPDVWPPKRKELKREPMPVPYLKSPPKVIPIDVGRQLLVDDFLIEKSDLERTFHRPTLHEVNPVIKADQPWETSGKTFFVAPFQGRVLHDPSDQLFKMWYLHSVKGDYYCNAYGYATSKDGIHWEKPVFAESKKPDAETVSPKKGTNLVIEGRRTCCNSVVLDHNAKSPDERFKMFSSDHIGGSWNCVYRTSPDGVHWSGSLVERRVWGDYVLAFYNPFRRMWVYEARIHGGEVGRSRAYMENPDSRELAERVPSNRGMSVQGDSVYWVGADDLDPRHPDPRFKGIKPQLYSLSATPYESLMLGLFAIWTGPDNRTVAKEGLQKHCQILTGFSRDGFHWDRTDRTPFISPSWKKGTWNFGNAQPVGGCCLVVGDKLYIYFSARLEDKTGMHGNATTGLATLRRDGFASLDAGDQAGSVTTRPITFKGKRLLVNVDCPKGELRAEVLDADGKVIEPFTLANCKAVSSDKTLAAVTWQGAADLSALSGKPVRLRFHLKNGSLYAFWVSPDKSGASHGYVAAGGPGFTGPPDTVGLAAAKPACADDVQPTKRVLLIGDSISIGYIESVRELLKDKAEVHGLPIAAKSSTHGLAEIDAHLAKMRWDVIHFNWGLNDLEHFGSGKHRIPLELYEKNLTKLVDKLEKTGAVLVWATTTPIPKGTGTRTHGDAVKYNAVAAKVLKGRSIRVNDLYAFVLPRLPRIQMEKDVHYTEVGYAVLGGEVASQVKLALSSAPKRDRGPLKIGLQKQLFVDDAVIHRRKGVVRRVQPAAKMNRPVLTPERPWEFSYFGESGGAQDRGIGKRIYVYGTALAVRMVGKLIRAGEP